MLFEDGSQFVRMEDFDWAERIGAQIDTLLPGSQHNILINNLYIVLAFIERSPMLLKTEAHQWAFEQLMLRDPSRSTLPSHEEVISFLRASGYPLYDLSDEECSGLINLIKAAHPDLDATWENML